MRRKSALLITAVVAFAGGLFAALTTLSLYSQSQPGSGFAAVPGEKGGWDVTGPYEVARDWPKPLSQLPGHEQWTWGAGEACFAETADRVFFIQMGELPKLTQQPALHPSVCPRLTGGLYRPPSLRLEDPQRLPDPDVAVQLLFFGGGQFACAVFGS